MRNNTVQTQLDGDRVLVSKAMVNIAIVIFGRARAAVFRGTHCELGTHVESSAQAKKYYYGTVQNVRNRLKRWIWSRMADCTLTAWNLQGLCELSYRILKDCRRLSLYKHLPKRGIESGERREREGAGRGGTRQLNTQLDAFTLTLRIRNCWVNISLGGCKCYYTGLVGAHSKTFRRVSARSAKKGAFSDGPFRFGSRSNLFAIKIHIFVSKGCYCCALLRGDSGARRAAPTARSNY
ncbi:hypothetical protein EVAR_23017_1 [Eumeta japonica]|uniref:Uncharacterized protein n=1 Tax=Eumeta variegata TaxID=151549 RepID=A0A4C1URE9_EUMVA|nr:hypothetical protein EVAR_23017_1 [Eumeta japonica]